MLECYNVGRLFEHPHDSNHVFAAGYKYDEVTYEYTSLLWESFDGGTTWVENIILGPQADWTAAYSADICAGDPSIIFVAGEIWDPGAGEYNPTIWKSIDGGATWGDATGDLWTYTTSYGWMYSIWVSPNDPDRVITSGYCSASDKVFVTTDGGATWGVAGLPGSSYIYGGEAYAYHASTNTLYAGTNGNGVWASTDQGLTFTDVSTAEGKPSGNYYLELDEKNGWLFAGTLADGLARMNVGAERLWVGFDEVDADVGGSVELVLNAPERVGHDYLIVGSVSGTMPGTAVGYTHVPLNRDWYTDYVLGHLNGYVYSGFFGTLDGDGMATATLNIPAVPGWAGTVTNYAFVTLHPIDYSSNAIDVIILP